MAVNKKQQQMLMSMQGKMNSYILLVETKISEATMRKLK
jgi:hypothetical protein